MPRDLEGKKAQNTHLPSYPPFLKFLFPSPTNLLLFPFGVLISFFMCSEHISGRETGICELHHYWNQIQESFHNFRFVCHLRMKNHYILFSNSAGPVCSLAYLHTPSFIIGAGRDQVAL